MLVSKASLLVTNHKDIHRVDSVNVSLGQGNLDFDVVSILVFAIPTVLHLLHKHVTAFRQFVNAVFFLFELPAWKLLLQDQIILRSLEVGQYMIFIFAIILLT